ncbi:Transcription factor FAR1-related protein [Alternaria alternata]|nr:Transcription factor FAR1-related protein [Alternaria alternata]
MILITIDIIKMLRRIIAVSVPTSDSPGLPLVIGWRAFEGWKQRRRGDDEETARRQRGDSEITRTARRGISISLEVSEQRSLDELALAGGSGEPVVFDVNKQTEQRLQGGLLREPRALVELPLAWRHVMAQSDDALAARGCCAAAMHRTKADHLPYDSYEEAYNALKAHGMQHGYGFVLKRSKPHNSDVKTRYYYHCDRFRKRQSTAKVPSTSTRPTGCPFKLVVFKTKHSDRWKLEVQDKHHNHPRSISPSAHNVYRRRTPAQKSVVELTTHAGARPMQILAALQKEDHDTLISASDIRSDMIAVREKQPGGRSPIEALLDNLSTSDWVFTVKKDDNNHVRNLFFAHQKQIEMVRANPDVLLMNCTYQTDKYKLPLLHIIGCTNLQTFYSAGFCFLTNQTQADYHWAIANFLLETSVQKPRVFISDQEEALKTTARSLLPEVPQLLCVWHINKNVQTKAQQTWQDADGVTRGGKKRIAGFRARFMKRWTQLVYAKSRIEFQLKWDELLDYYSHQQELCRYLQDTLYSTRTEWAAAWTSHHRHYNTITSSPVEGMHEVLNDHLMISGGDLLRVVRRIEEMIDSQYNKYSKDIASAKHSVKFEHRREAMPFLPPGIHNVLTPPAIECIRQQDLLRRKEQRQRQGGQPCSGLFEKMNGLPCRHTLQEVAVAGSTLRLSYPYDDHWRYQRDQEPSFDLSSRPHCSVLEPVIAQTRGGPGRNDALTRRDPSAFEQRVPLSVPRVQPHYQPQGQTLAEAVQEANTSVTVSVPTPEPGIDLVTTSISVSIPAPAPLPPPTSLRLSPPVAVAVPVTVTRPSVWQPPTLEEFLVDIERRKSQLVLYDWNDMISATSFLARTGQEGDPAKLVAARNMALTSHGLSSSCTPTMAWNYHFGDVEAFYAERLAQVDAQSALNEPQEVPIPRPKRVAAVAAPKAWKSLGPRKKRRER